MPTAKPNPLRLDPTRLAGPRRALRAEFARRLARLRADLRQLLLADDALNLRGPWGGDAGDKFAAFAALLDQRLALHLLAGQWWASHARDAFLKGAARTYDEVRKAALRDPQAHAGGKAEFLRGLLSGHHFPRAVKMVANALGIGERLRLLVAQLGEAIKSLAGQIAARLTRVAADLLGASATATAIWKAARAELAGLDSRVAMIVSSELTRAHASGQLAGMEELGITEVEAEVEWVRFAGACPRCRNMAGRRFTLTEAQGLIPAHPACKCSWRAVPTR